MHSTISRWLAAIMLCLAPVVLAAQPPTKPVEAPESIPRELVLALLNLGPGMGGGADIRVGKAPDDIPLDLLPPGFEILGSTTQFESSVIVLAAPQQPDSAVARYEAHLLSGGWTKPPVPQSRPMRGFVSADVGQVAFDRPDMACRGEALVTYAGTYRRNGGSLVKVSYNRGTRYSMCKTRQDVTTYRSPYDEAPVPLLRAPLGSITNDGNGMSASGNNTFTLSTRLSTRLKPGEVVVHYDKQMREQGWTSIGDGSVEFLAAHTYRKNDEQGRTWTGMLFSVTLPDSSQQDVTLKLTRSQASGAK
jgi:hypothetical protein